MQAIAKRARCKFCFFDFYDFLMENIYQDKGLVQRAGPTGDMCLKAQLPFNLFIIIINIKMVLAAKMLEMI